MFWGKGLLVHPLFAYLKGKMSKPRIDINHFDQCHQCCQTNFSLVPILQDIASFIVNRYIYIFLKKKEKKKNIQNKGN